MYGPEGDGFVSAPKIQPLFTARTYSLKRLIITQEEEHFPSRKRMKGWFVKIAEVHRLLPTGSVGSTTCNYGMKHAGLPPYCKIFGMLETWLSVTHSTDLSYIVGA